MRRVCFGAAFVMAFLGSVVKIAYPYVGRVGGFEWIAELYTLERIRARLGSMRVVDSLERRGSICGIASV